MKIPIGAQVKVLHSSHSQLNPGDEGTVVGFLPAIKEQKGPPPRKTLPGVIKSHSPNNGPSLVGRPFKEPTKQELSFSLKMR